MTSQQQLDEAFIDWYYTFLPALGVTRSINKGWQTLPLQYQGLGLPVMSIEKLSLSLQYLQKHWGSTTPYGQAL